jgi:hypothetical protein
MTFNETNVQGAFDLMASHMSEASKRTVLVIDFDIFWPLSGVGQMAKAEATRLNTYGGRTLSIGDRRTLGGKYYLQAYQKAREHYLNSKI